MSSSIKDTIYVALKDVNISSDDHSFSLQYVYKKIKATRAELLRQDYSNGDTAISGIAQTLDCVNMKVLEPTECGDLEMDGLLRSCKPIPDPIETKQLPMITGVYTANGRVIEFSTLKQLADSKKRRFQKADPEPVAFIRNKYLYIANYEDIDCLDTSVEGHFYDLEDVYKFNNPDKCLPVYDMPFEVPEYLTRRIIRIVTDELRLKMGVPIDSVNNSKEDLNQNNAN